ncbi:hypothetical protein GGI07_002625 [Coemansia sp. Benny D115]|nr:hypothetical protein GGI07_002625 [Coemansia sp. Benny D115]
MAASVLASAAGQLTDSEALSDIIGYVSLMCWVVVMFPQIWLNYKRKSGEGVSLIMMVAWVLGDVFNITGAVLQGLVLSPILIGSYYLFVDTTLLSQTIYYRIVYKAHLAKAPASEEEEARLLAAPPSRESNGGYDEVRPGECEAGALGNGMTATNTCQRQNPGAEQVGGGISSRVAWYSRWQLSDVLAVVLSLAALTNLLVMIGALVAPRHDGSPEDNGNGASIGAPRAGSDRTPLTQIVAQAMGTASAIVYIMSYVPQAVQNYRRKSCEGLSMWLFLLSLMGNTTYSMAILVVSLDPQYLAPYVPWLLGALVPCVIQIVILYQFQIYSH